MRVLFLNPPFHPRFSREQRSPAVTKSGTLYYPKWLATAAGVAIKNGAQQVGTAAKQDAGKVKTAVAGKDSG